MTDTLLREFEEWLLETSEHGDLSYNDAILAAIEKLEELKKKYNV
jgi:hypothetical protein